MKINGLSLYEINETILNVIDEDGRLVDPTSGEVMTAEQFAQLCGDLDKGIEQLACWVKTLRAESKALKEEEDALAERRQAKDKTADGVEERIKFYLNGRKLETSKCVIGYRISHPLVIEDESKIPAEWFKAAKPTVMKKEITAAIKAGKEIPGCHLGDNLNMQIK